MNKILLGQLKRLEIKHPPKTLGKSRLRVYYGWAKLGKVRKREAISVIFENQAGVADHHRMGKTLSKAQETVYWRYQTDKEANGAENCNRVFTEYSVFLDDPKIRGSLERALQINSLSDQYNLGEAKRKEIAARLRQSYMSAHRDYKEPQRQLYLFEE